MIPAMRHLLLATALLLGGLGPYAQVRAWGVAGHQIVGAYADQRLEGTRTQLQIRSILGSDSLEQASVWADCAKGYCGPLSPDQQQFVQAHPDHRVYHYTDVPFQLPAYVAGTTGTGDADIVQTLRRCIAILRDRAPAASDQPAFTKAQALLLLVHLVGDLHQPLHVGSAYVNSDNASAVPPALPQAGGSVQPTEGGNRLLLGSRNLHAYWDSQVVTYAMRRVHAQTPADFAQRLQALRVPEPPMDGDPDGWPAQWANQSLAVAREAYGTLLLIGREGGTPAEPGALWRVQAPADYARNATTLATTQLYRAGEHLTQLLLALWP